MLLLLGAGPATPQTGSVVLPPVAAFTGTPLTGSAPLSVAFTDASTGTPTSWLWEKNDGSGWVNFAGTPAAKNPTETFAVGTWSVRLTATNAGGSNTLTRTNYVTASFTPALTPSLVGWFPFGPAWDFTDVGGTNPCGSGDLIRVAKPAAGTAGVNLTQGTSGNRPTLDGGAGTWDGLFDGVNDVLSTTSVSGYPSGSSARSVAFWLNQATRTNDVYSAIFSMAGASGQAWEVLFNQIGGTVYLFGDSVNGSANLTISGAEIPSLGAEHHVAFTMDGSGNWAYYLDGAATKSGTFAAAINTSLTTIRVGQRWPGGGGGCYSGSIDQLVVSAAALTPTDVTNLFTYGHGAG